MITVRYSLFVVHCSLSNIFRDFGFHFPENEQTHEKQSHDNRRKDADLRERRIVVFRQSQFVEMNDETDRIGQKDRVIFCWNDLQRVYDRRAVEKCLNSHFPNLGEITKLHIEGRGDERKRKDQNESEENEKREHENGGNSRPKAVPNKKNGDDDEIHAEYEGRIDRWGDDNRPARNIYFRDKGRFPEKRIESRHRAFGKKVKKHDGSEELQRKMLNAGTFRIEDRRKNKVQDEESEQRLQKRPNIPQNRTVIAQLEIRPGQRPDQLPIIFMFLRHWINDTFFCPE